MLKKRLISCLILRDHWIVQSLNFKRFLPVGRASVAVEFMKNWDIDEIILLDITASRDSRKPDLGLVADISRKCFVPLTMGGGIHTINDIKTLIRAGADKISINSEALRNPTFIKESSNVFGSQCIVISMDIKLNDKAQYEVFGNSGKEPTGLDPITWARKAEELGAGEIFLNSIDRDGSRNGYDLNLIRQVAQAVEIPVIACGGVGKMEHFVEGFTIGGAAAVAAANIFQHTEHSTIIAKAYLKNAGLDIRLSTLANYKKFEFDTNGRILKKSDSELEEIWFEKHKLEMI